MSIRRSKRLETKEGITSPKENIHFSPLTPKLKSLEINNDKLNKKTSERKKRTIGITEKSLNTPSAKKKSPDRVIKQLSPISIKGKTRRNLFNTENDNKEDLRIKEISEIKTNSSDETQIIDTIVSPRKLILAVPNGEVRQSPRKAAISYLTPLQMSTQQSACYKAAKNVLHNKIPNEIIGRVTEFNLLNDFVNHCLRSCKCASYYISGSPGTGKTAVVSLLMKTYKDKGEQVVYINCMSFCQKLDFYSHLYNEITNEIVKKNAKDLLFKFLTLKNKKKCIILILDEIDQLSSNTQEDLYTVFEWPFLENSRLILIGIANSLDLTDRILPRLKLKPFCQPKLLTFSPYTQTEIANIVTERLKEVSVNGESVFEPSAIEFCSRKVAAITGDIRKALNICKRAVEIIECEVRSDIESISTDVPLKRSVSNIPKKIDIATVMKIINEVYGGNNTKSDMLLYHKLVICSFLQLLKTCLSKEITLGKLYDNYVKITKKGRFTTVSQSEFVSICTLLEMRGIFLIKKTKTIRSFKISLKTDVDELLEILKDEALASKIIDMKF